MPTLSDLKEASSGERLSLKQLKGITKFKGVIHKAGFKKDKNDRKCLYLEIDTTLNGKLDEPKTLTQKYTPSHIGKLVEIMDELGVEDTDDLIGKILIFKKYTFEFDSVTSKPRYFPEKFAKKAKPVAEPVDEDDEDEYDDDEGEDEDEADDEEEVAPPPKPKAKKGKKRKKKAKLI